MRSDFELIGEYEVEMKNDIRYFCLIKIISVDEMWLLNDFFDSDSLWIRDKPRQMNDNNNKRWVSMFIYDQRMNYILLIHRFYPIVRHMPISLRNSWVDVCINSLVGSPRYSTAAWRMYFLLCVTIAISIHTVEKPVICDQ